MSIRSTLLACLTSLAIIAVLIAFIHKNSRYELVGTQDGIYVLDKRSTLMHHCDKEKCKLLTPDGTDLQTLRTLAGVPDVNLVRTPEPPVCVPQTPKAPEQAKYVNISSFQSIHDPLPSVNPVMQPQAQALGMDNVQQSVQKPVNPFPQSAQAMQPIQPMTQAAYSPETQPAAMPMDPNMQQQQMMPQPQPDIQAVSAPVEAPVDMQQQAQVPADPYGQAAGMAMQPQAQPQVQALDNPYGEAASGGQQASVQMVSDPYTQQAAPSPEQPQPQVQALDNPYGEVAAGGMA
ncbi:MAG: hypothetical protein Q8K36_03555 [Alphaproteobacteria bacterium]|nr:hypothetical protein [Alphaproteobacteria bacterium]